MEIFYKKEVKKNYVKIAQYWKDLTEISAGNTLTNNVLSRACIRYVQPYTYMYH